MVRCKWTVCERCCHCHWLANSAPFTAKAAAWTTAQASKRKWTPHQWTTASNKEMTWNWPTEAVLPIWWAYDPAISGHLGHRHSVIGWWPAGTWGQRPPPGQIRPWCEPGPCLDPPNCVNRQTLQLVTCISRVVESNLVKLNLNVCLMYVVDKYIDNSRKRAFSVFFIFYGVGFHNMGSDMQRQSKKFHCAIWYFGKCLQKHQFFLQNKNPDIKTSKPQMRFTAREQPQWQSRCKIRMRNTFGLVLYNTKILFVSHPSLVLHQAGTTQKTRRAKLANINFPRVANVHFVVH